MKHASPRRDLDRRNFLRASTLAGLSVGFRPRIGAAAKPAARIQRSVRLGRTGLEVSDIGFGGGQLRGDQSLVRHALERGISYFDTAEGYGGGQSETTMADALRDHREQIVLVSKTKAGANERRAALMARLEASLQRLRTDRVEIYLNHAVNDLGRMQNPEWWEFAERAKQQGKIRFTGISGHGGRLAECLEWGLDQDLLDVILVAYNFGHAPSFAERFTRSFDFVAKQPELPRLLAKAKRRDVGVVAMKTLLGAKLNDLRPYETPDSTFAQAALRWVLANPHTDNLIISMKSRALIDEYVGASGATELSNRDEALIERYRAIHGETQCRYGCTSCSDACPAKVAISDVLRTRMYDVDYGEPDSARSEYAALPNDATACLRCSAEPCAGSCPHGLDIRALTADAHRRLA
ncbi:MAG: aldo/keto reductase [Myxococcota bacterium]|nr:aldo/keto reductase [Myxococcota bacterium]